MQAKQLSQPTSCPKETKLRGIVFVTATAVAIFMLEENYLKIGNVILQTRNTQIHLFLILIFTVTPHKTL